jgi:diguanylate cyclase (GGDEF)-like protein
LNALPSVERTRFLAQLGGAVERARNDQSHLGLILVDLTNLSRINHFHGYDTGDQVLQTAYDCLLDLSKLPGSVFRVGCHRFSFILQDLGNPAFIALALNRVQRALDAELQGNGDWADVEVKVGVAINRNGVQEFMAMLARAEDSLARVKLRGALDLENVLAQDTAPASTLWLEQRLTEALHDNAFELHFQPKVNLVTGAVHSAEALLRWQDEEGEPVSPELIAEWAESAGRSYDLAKWVIHRTLRQLHSWQGRLDIGLALNIPANLAGEPDLPTLLHDALAIWAAPPGRLTVEITERAIIEDKQSGYDNLLKLRDLGIILSIDDFGTGYSSLSYFKHIPATELKIDKSFVDSMLVDAQDMELVKIIIHIAHQFGLAVVAEGVESRESLDRLRELGCDYAQGFYLSPPLPAQAFEAWVERWTGLD